MTMKPTIRAATREDREQWAALRSELWPDCSRERHELEVTQLLASQGIVAVAELEGKLVGFAESSIRNDHVEGTTEAPVPYLEGWFVKPAARGQGIGRALLGFLEHWAVQSGYRELASDAELDNHYSIRLHQQLGFRETGRSVHFVKRLTSGRRSLQSVYGLADP
jgi:aminoglycoside 6'-N-acetyltransferase I